MGIFKYNVVDFKKINLKGITKFSEKFDSKINMSVKMDSNGIGIKVYDEDTKASICTYGVRELTKEEKEKIIGDKYNEKNDVDRIYMNCDYELTIKTNGADEFRLAYLLAMYISSCTEMVLLNYMTKEALPSIELKKYDKKKLNIITEQFRLREKYGPNIKKFTEVCKKTTIISGWVWAFLIGISILTVAVFLFMLEFLKVENNLLLSLPFVALGLLICIYFVKRWNSYKKALKNLSGLRYEYDRELCILYEEREPKKPSDRSKKIVNFSDIYGFMILPCLVIGCVFYFFDYILLGTIGICLPWGLMLSYKKFILDVRNNNLEEELFEWLERSFSKEINDKVVALNVELSEIGDNNWEIELLGCLDFDLENSMWSKKNICEVSDRKYKFTYKCYWEDAEFIIKNMIKDYIYTTEKGKKLLDLKCIVIGFKDGSVQIIYLNESEKKDV